MHWAWHPHNYWKTLSIPLTAAYIWHVYSLTISGNYQYLLKVLVFKLTDHHLVTCTSRWAGWFGYHYVMFIVTSLFCHIMNDPVHAWSCHTRCPMEVTRWYELSHRNMSVKTCLYSLWTRTVINLLHGSQAGCAGSYEQNVLTQAHSAGKIPHISLVTLVIHNVNSGSLTSLNMKIISWVFRSHNQEQKFYYVNLTWSWLYTWVIISFLCCDVA